jgi:RND family efflux transporter MFP subunit
MSLGALVLVAAVVPLSSACNTTSGETSRGAGGQRPTVAVETTSIKRISVQRQIDLSGTLLSPDQAKVSSEVAGVVREVPVELGREVKKGDVLVRLEPREIELALDRAESALRQVEAQLGITRTQDIEPPPDEQIASVRQAAANRDDARAAVARAQQLNGRGLVSQVDRESAETRLKVAEANYSAALDTTHSLKASLQDRRASFELAKKKLADTVIRAPVAGSVSERLVQPGEFIRENMPVVTIVAMNPLKLKTAIQEKFAGVIRPGQPVTFEVEAFPDEAFTGRVAYVSPAVDQATRTFAIEAIVANDDRRLKPGFFAKGIVGTKLDEDVTAVPEDAVSTMAGVSSVYIIEDGKVVQRTITTGVHQDKLIEVVAGLKGTEFRRQTLAAGGAAAIGGRAAIAAKEVGSDSCRRQRETSRLRHDDDGGAHRAGDVLVPGPRPRFDAEDGRPGGQHLRHPARRERRGDRDADHQAD